MTSDYPAFTLIGLNHAFMYKFGNENKQCCLPHYSTGLSDKAIEPLKASSLEKDRCGCKCNSTSQNVDSSAYTLANRYSSGEHMFFQLQFLSGTSMTNAKNVCTRPTNFRGEQFDIGISYEAILVSNDFAPRIMPAQIFHSLTIQFR